jgi:hypothetical protein
MIFVRTQKLNTHNREEKDEDNKSLAHASQLTIIYVYTYYIPGISILL